MNQYVVNHSEKRPTTDVNSNVSNGLRFMIEQSSDRMIEVFGFVPEQMIVVTKGKGRREVDIQDVNLYDASITIINGESGVNKVLLRLLQFIFGIGTENSTSYLQIKESRRYSTATDASNIDNQVFSIQGVSEDDNARPNIKVEFDKDNRIVRFIVV